MRAVETTDFGPGEKQIEVNGVRFAAHDKVRLHLGQRRSDALDAMFNGRVATVETIYRDYGDKVYLAVTLDDDPAQQMQRELNRYLYFFPDEVEPLQPGETAAKEEEQSDVWFNPA